MYYYCYLTEELQASRSSRGKQIVDQFFMCKTLHQLVSCTAGYDVFLYKHDDDVWEMTITSHLQHQDLYRTRNHHPASFVLGINSAGKHVASK